MLRETHQESLVPVWAAPGQTSSPASFLQDPPAGLSDCSCCLRLPRPVSNQNTVHTHNLNITASSACRRQLLPTWDSVFRSTACPSSDCTSVFTGLCSLVGGWPGSESGSCMKNSSSPLLRLHLCSRSGRTSGSGRGGGLKVPSDFFIPVSSGSCFTEEKIMRILRVLFPDFTNHS